MSHAVVCRRYAKALIDLAVQESLVDQIVQNLERTVQMVVQNRSLKNFMFSPLHKSDEKQKILDGVAAELKISGLLKKFLKLLIRSDRFPQLEGIYKEYVHLADQLKNRAEADVTTAVPLSDEDKERLRAKMQDLTGKNIYLKVNVDPRLIGGVITRIGSVVYDGSVRAQMMKLKERIMMTS
ncbi:MAG: ATP synthase F1 subunit delta [bacterium]